MPRRQRRHKGNSELLMGLITLIITTILIIALILLIMFILKKEGKKEPSESQSTEEITKTPAAADTSPPLIEGAKDISIFLGDTISYKKGITVTDNVDVDVQLEIDNSKVDRNKLGEYTVVYKATDSSGNSTSQEIIVTVEEKINLEIKDDTYAFADDVLGQITSSAMTDREKAWNIYEWVKNNISYIGHSEKTDWISGAYTGFTEKTGDCYIFFATTKALLTRADIPNIDITRVGGKTNHYWHLVDIGQGWYHYDTTPQKDYLQVFLLTDEEVAAYTARSDHNYYSFDESLYPERAK